ncbi:MAG: thioredoxin domain-containing protein [Bifidobacterium castoris]|nr:thioredoxin domain-containing protein [Bifidobacterium castoris]
MARNNPSKRDRREAEAAARQAQAAQAAKERRQQTIIGAIVAAVLVVLIVIAGVAVWRSTHPAADNASTTTTEEAEDAKTKLATSPSKPSVADDQGGILISADGYDKPIADVPTIGIYMDFMCPGCGSLNQNLDKDLVKMADAGQINLDLHFMSFMDRFSSDEYSTRTANMALYIADHDPDPDHLLKFMSNLYAADFQPDESNYVPISDEKIAERAVDAGVDKDVADKAITRQYDDYLDAVNTYTPTREELWSTSGSMKGSMSTPTVTINGKYWDIHDTKVTSKASLTEALCDAIGLKPEDIGVKGDLPSIGAKGDALIP